MKKLLALILALLVTVSLCACGQVDRDDDDDEDEDRGGGLMYVLPGEELPGESIGGDSQFRDPVSGEAPLPSQPQNGQEEEAKKPYYALYWNVDRAEYDGKSEAGMSSRMPEADGFFYVRFFHDGEILELRVRDRKTVNAIEVKDLMGLEFDEDGIVVGVIDVGELPLEKTSWGFYVQSAGGNLIKTNSSETFNGLEVLLETNDNTGIYDMTGLSGPVGCETTPKAMDRIYAVMNLDGELTHVFIYERSE